MSVKIVYTPVATPVTLTFTRGPVEMLAYVDGRAHDNLSTSGAVRERVVENNDILIDLPMPHMVLGSGDLEAWGTFLMWALGGGTFQFWPNATLGTDVYNCVIADNAWNPKWNAPWKYASVVKIRILQDASAPASPVQILRRYYGLTG
jgi:hypothetical protein